MMRVPLALAALSCVAAAQEPVVYSRDVAGPLREAGQYAVSSAFDFGYRFASTGGSQDLYRASVNFGNGLRLLQGRLRLHSSDGQRPALDELSIRFSGLGGDPYQVLSVRAGRNGLYRYDMQHRLVRYHNRLPALWSGEHGLTVQRVMQSHEITLFPDSDFSLLLGLDRNTRTGPGFGSVGTTDNFGVLDARSFLRYQADLRQASRQYRAGFTARLPGLALTATHAVDLYREEGAQTDASKLPSAAANVQPVDRFARSEPFHGRTPITTVALRASEDRPIGFHSRFVYAGGTRNSTLMDSVSVPSSATAAAGFREALIVGDADREQASGEAALVLLPAARLTITNTTAFHNTRIDGSASYVELGFYRDEYLRFDHLGIRRLSNAAEVSYRAARSVSLFGAYRLSARRARSSDALRYPDFGFASELSAVDNSVRSGTGGVRWLPGRNVRASFDVEVGRADRPLAATSERRFRNQAARFSWRRRQLTLSGYFKSRVNDNPAELLAYSATSRSQGGHGSWASPNGGLVLDGSYNWVKTDVTTGILNLFDAGFQPEPLRSVYVASIHSLNFAIRSTPTSNVTLHAGYNLTTDTGGDERARIPGGSSFSLQDGILMTRLPMSYHSPQARISLQLRQRLAWNVGWQYYGYAESIAGLRGFRSHVGYTSFTIGF